MNDVAHLAGPPRSISGFVPYRNTTSSPVTISDVTIDDDDSDTSLVLPVPETTVEPGRLARIELRLPFPPHAKPGDYPLEITVGESQVAAVAHVAEAHDVGLSPDLLAVPNVPDAVFAKTLVIANEGNVDVDVVEAVELPLYREDVARTTLGRIAASRILDPAIEVQQLPEPQAVLQVVAAGGPRAIPAGATEPVVFHVSVPADLPQSQRWLAGLPIALRTVVLVVMPGSAPPRKG